NSVGQSHRSDATKGAELVLSLMWTNDHNVWPNVKLDSLPILLFVWHPGANVHVCDADLVDMRIPPSQTVLHPLHKDRVEAAGLVVWIPGNARKAGPLVCSLPQNPVFTAGSCRPIKERRIFGDESRTSPQSVCNLFGICCGTKLRGSLRDDRCRSENAN